MNVDCLDCRWAYYDPETNYSGCKHPENEGEGDTNFCPDYYSKEDARADAKNEGKDRY